MPFTDLTIPSQDNSQNRAYLNGVFVGYGELAEVAEYYQGITVTVRVMGEIIIPPELFQEAHALIIDRTHGNVTRDLVFSGRKETRWSPVAEQVENVPVVVTQLSWSQGYYGNHSMCVKLRTASPLQTHPQPLCHRCSYFIPSPFRTCNAFHPVDNVAECHDFRTD